MNGLMRYPRAVHLASRASLWMLLLAVMLMATAYAQAPPSPDELIERGDAASADRDLLEQVAERAQNANLSPQETAQILEPAVDLAERDLPSTMALRKALEGTAKQVPAGRLQPAIQEVATATEEAGSLVDEWAGGPEVRDLIGETDADLSSPESPGRARLIEGATQARMQDLPPETIQQLLESVPANTERRPIAPQDIAAAVEVLPDMADEGAVPEDMTTMLTSALDAGYHPSEIRQLPTAVEMAGRQAQQPPGVVARGAAQAIAQGTPASDIIDRLFDGDLPGPPDDRGEGPPDDAGPPDNGPPGSNSF